MKSAYQTPAAQRTVEDFQAHWSRAGDDLGCADELSAADGALGRSIELGGRVLANRFAIHPMEGWDAERDGAPSELTLRRWTNFGRSGAKLIWGGEAFAVRGDGRANPHQLHLADHADAVRGLVALRDALRTGHVEAGEDPDELYCGLQLTHSGRFSRPDGDAAPLAVCRNEVVALRCGQDPDQPLVSDGELEGIGERYVAAARAAAAAGFDFVDVKCCHGYLMHELLGARSRPGPYGGSFENRTRLFRRIVAAIRTACPDLEIGVRVSIADVHPYTPNPETWIGEPDGWQRHLPYLDGFGIDRDDPRRFDFEEPFRFLALCRDLGVRLVNISLGSPYYCPHVIRPAAYPPSDGYLAPEDPLVGVARHLHAVRRCREAFPELTLVGSGWSYLQDWLPWVAQHEVEAGHVDFVGLGRMVLSYPELPRDVLAGEPLRRARVCRTFSDCTTAPRHGLVSGCYPLDPVYRARPEADELAGIKKKLRGGGRNGQHR